MHFYKNKILKFYLCYFNFNNFLLYFYTLLHQVIIIKVIVIRRFSNYNAGMLLTLITFFYNTSKNQNHIFV